MAELGFNVNEQWGRARGFPGEPAFTDFLNEDLRNTSGSVLDPRIFGVQVEKAVFQGKAVLQVTEVSNVNENPQNQQSAVRQTLKFRLTDGFSEVVAVEQTSTGIPASIRVGGKVLVVGPVVVRRGVVLLNSCNVLLLPPH